MANVRSSQARLIPWSIVLGLFCIVVTLASPDEVFVPDLSFTSQSEFKTVMSNEDLDAARKQEIKSQLEPQLADLFKNITGFRGVEVTVITINEQEALLVTNWTVRLNRNDPKFVNSTPEEIGDIVRSELEAASQRYKDSIIIDTSKHARPSMPVASDTEDDHKLALGLGLGLGLGIPVLAAVILTIVLLVRRQKKRSEKPLSISDVTSSHNSGGSSKMDERNFMPGPGGFLSSISGKSAPSSVSGRSDYITPVIYDTLSLSAPSEASGGYAVFNDHPGDRRHQSRP